MKRSTETISNARIRTAVLGASLAVAVASGGALAATPFVPVRRDARLELTTTESSATPAFVSAELVIPRATTRELAAYAGTAGGRAAAPWLCDAYTATPDADGASLKQLVAATAATDSAGIAAADALVCPRIRRHLFALKTKRPSIYCFLDCDDVTYRYRSPVLAYRKCEATDEQRAALDAAACKEVLLGHSRRGSALRFFAKRAAMDHACLSIRLSASGKPAVALGTAASGCE
jgi:hypothetical protein